MVFSMFTKTILELFSRIGSKIGMKQALMFSYDK